MKLKNGKGRAFAATKVRQVGDSKNRTLRIIGTDETPDRYNSIILTSGWDLKNFRANPVFLWAHDPDQPPIGKVVNIESVTTKRTFRGVGKDGEDEVRDVKGLAFDVQFAERDVNPFADVVYQLFLKGFMKGSSVGFQNNGRKVIEDEDELKKLGLKPPSGVVLTKNELLELSAVPIPANPNALVDEMKGLAPVEARSFFDQATSEDVTELWFAQALRKIAATFDEIKRDSEAPTEEPVERQEDEDEPAEDEDEPVVEDDDKSGRNLVEQLEVVRQAMEMQQGAMELMKSHEEYLIQEIEKEEGGDEDEPVEEPAAEEEPDGGGEVSTSAGTDQTRTTPRTSRPMRTRLVTIGHLRDHLKQVESRFMPCLKGLVRKNELTEVQLRIEDLTSEVQALKRSGGASTPKRPTSPKRRAPNSPYSELEKHGDKLTELADLVEGGSQE